MNFCATLLWLLVLAGSPVPQQPPTTKQQTASANTAVAASAIDPAKEADIRKLMEISGTAALAKQIMDSMSENIKPLMTSSLPPGEYREKLIDLFFAKFHSKADVKQLLDMEVPIYSKYFSDEEVKGLIQFYQTPLGQKTISVLPKLMGEMSALRQQWGEQLGRQLMREVLAEHPDLVDAMAAAEKAQQH